MTDIQRVDLKIHINERRKMAIIHKAEGLKSLALAEAITEEMDLLERDFEVNSKAT